MKDHLNPSIHIHTNHNPNRLGSLPDPSANACWQLRPLLLTTLSFGGDERNKQMTTYFRTTFRVEDGTKGTLEAVGILLRRDDGAVVYINGREVVRSNMPPGKVVFSTPASSAVAETPPEFKSSRRILSSLDENKLHRYIIPPDVLAAGLNTVAVEVHQAGRGSLTPRVGDEVAKQSSEDMFFDLQISGYTDDDKVPEPAKTP